MKNSHPVPVVLESLESKLAPSGVVTFTHDPVKDTLTIVGDGGNNNFTMTVDANGLLDVTGSDSTTFILNGNAMSSITDLAVLATIKISLGDGNDTLRLTGGDFFSDKTFEVLGGKGDDTVTLGTTAKSMFFAGTTKFDLGEGLDQFSIFGSAYFTTKTAILMGAGDDYVDFSGASAAKHVFAAGLSVDFGAGQGSFSSAGILQIINGKLEIKATDPTATMVSVDITGSDTYIDDGLTLALAIGTGGAANINLTGNTIKVGGPLSITTGAGNDTIHLGGELAVTGAITIDLKDGANQITFDDEAQITANSILLKGGKAGLNVLLDDDAELVTSGAFTIDAKANTLGTNTFELDPGSSIEAGTNFSYLGSAQNDTVTLRVDSDLTSYGNMAFTLGAGNNTLNMTDCSLFSDANIVFTGLAGNDTLNLDNTYISALGSLTANLGAGSNSINTLDDSRLYINGGFTYIGGAGSDSVDLDYKFAEFGRTISLTMGDGYNEFNMTTAGSNVGHVSSISYTGGKGDDNLRLTRVEVRGSTTAKMSSGGNFMETFQTTLIGAVNMQSTSLATESDSLFINTSTFNGTLTASLGAGISTVLVDDSIMNGQVSLNTGAGDDTVKLDNAALSGANHWNHIVRIQTGTGIDNFTLGSGTPSEDAAMRNYFARTPEINLGVEANLYSQNGSRNLAGITIFVPIISGP